MPVTARSWGAAVLFVGIVFLGAPADAGPASPPPGKDWHVDLGLTLGFTTGLNNALPPRIGLRVVGSWKWIGADLRLDVLPLVLYDGADGEQRGSPFVSLGEGIRIIAIPDYWVTPYAVVLAEQIVNTRSRHPVLSLGPILGVQFQWRRFGFFLEGGVPFILVADRRDLNALVQDASVKFLWELASGFIVRF